MLDPDPDPHKTDADPQHCRRTVFPPCNYTCPSKNTCLRGSAKRQASAAAESSIFSRGQPRIEILENSFPPCNYTSPSKNMYRKGFVKRQASATESSIFSRRQPPRRDTGEQFSPHATIFLPARTCTEKALLRGRPVPRKVAYFLEGNPA
jgi:hypothetical protein